MIVQAGGDAPAGLLELFPGMRTHGVVFLRLSLAGQEIGALMVWGRTPFTDAHAERLASVAEPLTLAMVNARQHRDLQRLQARLAEDHRALAADVQRTLGTEVVGADFGLRAVMEMVRRIAPSDRPALLLGETGTGKEIVAHALHAGSPRGAGPFVSLQCGAVPDALLDSELFGHEQGAFTGALERNRGRFERAHGGTLFLDEVGELTADAQVKLLRVLQEGRFERVGGTEGIEVDVRVVAATHRDLERMVRQGAFREDLWYRLNVLPVRIPPLRARRGDVPSLVQHFVLRRSREFGRRPPAVSSETMKRLVAYDWPGNVRELQNVVERALLLSPGDELVVADLGGLAPDVGAVTAGMLGTLDEAIAAHIRRVLDHTEGQIAGAGGAAEVLDVKPSTLRHRMRKLGLL
jgi:transcriptional regulator with GAF, ATPase, and Fis domain